jgi:hypothetical protein
VTDGDSAEVTDGNNAEDAAWRDLIDRFDAPAFTGDAPAPWPAIEDLGNRAPGGEDGGAGATGDTAAADSTATGDRTTGVASAYPTPSLPGATDADPLEDEHFIPPTPPPLNLDPVTKGAWAGLFGGPGYLIVATIAGWSVPGWAAFCAVAAFIAGFTVLVLRMGDDPPKDSGSGNGAVV